MIVMAMIIVRSVQVGTCLIVLRCNCRVMPLTFYQFVNQLWHCKCACTSNLKLAHIFCCDKRIQYLYCYFATAQSLAIPMKVVSSVCKILYELSEVERLLY